MTEDTAAHIAQRLWAQIQSLDNLITVFTAVDRGVIPPPTLKNEDSRTKIQAIIADAPKKRQRLLWMLEDIARKRGMAEGYTIFHLDPTVHDSLRDLYWSQILPDWSLLKALPVARAWELVAYSANIRPELLEEKWPGPSAGAFRDWLSRCGRAFNERLKITEAAISAGALKNERIHGELRHEAFVNPHDFIVWADSADLSVPEGMRAAAGFNVTPAPTPMPKVASQGEPAPILEPPESPQQRFERLLSWARDEVKVRGWRGATSRVAEREGISRTAIESIFKRHDDGKKFLSERSQHVGIQKIF